MRFNARGEASAGAGRAPSLQPVLPICTDVKHTICPAYDGSDKISW